MKKGTVIIMACVCYLSTTAQTFTSYTTDSGLVNNNVLCVAVAANDVMWFGTQEGISSFDGTTWTNFTTTTDSTLAHNTIQCISVMSDGDVWVGTDYGASRYHGGVWETHTEAFGLGDDRVKYIREDANGDIWFGHNDGVSLLQGLSTWTSWGTAEGLPFGGVTCIDFDSNGDKLLGTGLGGVAVFDDSTFMLVTETERLLNDKVRAIAVDGGNNKWIGTADGVSVFNPDGYLVEQHTIMLALPPPDTLNPVEDLRIAGDGNIWTGIYVDYLVTEGGVATFDGASWTYYDVSDGLIGPVVRGIGIDSQDNIWVATSTGISKISNVPASNQWGSWDNDPAYPSDTVTIAIAGPNEFPRYIRAYPIPTSTTISIESDRAIREVEIISLQGTILQTINSLDQSQITITVEDLKAGMYLARVRLEDSTELIRLVKQ